jgi:hypothetical protein
VTVTLAMLAMVTVLVMTAKPSVYHPSTLMTLSILSLDLIVKKA